MVSIPFSTIKRENERRRIRFNKQFQFHLVRLKVQEWVRIGAIALFQFHLVRLKVARCPVTEHLCLFQFHLVRLKELPKKGKKGATTLFQFHLVRLKVEVQ